MKTIEFMGMPKAGKSTQVELLETMLKHGRGSSVRKIQEGARICPLDKKEGFLYVTWSFHNTMNRLMEAQQTGFDYILIDRGVYDHIAFTTALYKSGRITEEQYTAQASYFKEFSFLEDLVLAHVISPEESLRREHKYHNFDGIVMNQDFLAELSDAYQETLPLVYQDYLVVDGSKPLRKNAAEILDFVACH